MITFRRMARYVAAEPFRSYRITMTDGRLFDIRHPEMVHVGRSRLTISTFLSDEPEEPTEQEIVMALQPIETVDWLEVTASA